MKLTLKTLTLSACGMFAAVAAPAAELPAKQVDPYGVCAHVSRGEFGIASKEFKLMRSAGINWVRTDFDWLRIQSAKGAEWNFKRLDELIALAKKSGMNVLPILDYDVPWATPAWKHLDLWREYVRRTVTHFQKDLRYWEIWNEENLASMWRDRPNAARYAELLKASYLEIKKIDPTLQVLYGGTAGIPMPFIEESLKAGAASGFDIMNIHPYRKDNVPEDALVKDIHDLRALLAKYGAGSKPLWITEIGWPTNQANSIFREIFIPVLEKAGFDLKQVKIACIHDPAYPFSTISSTLDFKKVFPMAKAVDAIPLKKLASLNPKEYPILVPSVDETFPMAYFDALESYVKKGGTLIFSRGVPLYYDLVKKADGRTEKVQVDDRYRNRLHIGWGAWWTDKAIPHNTTKTAIAPEFRDKVKMQDLPGEIFLTDKKLKKGDQLVPVLYGVRDSYRGVTSALFDLNSDLKGNIVVVTYKSSAGGSTEQFQAEVLPRTYLLAFSAGVQRLFWYEFQSPEGIAFDQESHFGIVHKDLSPKPAYIAYKTLAAMRPSGSTVPVVTISPKGIYTAAWTRPDGKKVHAVWTARESKKCALAVRGTIESAAGYLGKKLSVNASAFTATPQIVYLTGPESVTVK